MFGKILERARPLAAKQGLCLALRKVGPGKPGIVKCGGHFSLTELFPCCILMLLSKKEGGSGDVHRAKPAAGAGKAGDH